MSHLTPVPSTLNTTNSSSLSLAHLNGKQPYCASLTISSASVVGENNDLGYGVGKIIRGVFDNLWNRCQTMWTPEPSAIEIARQRNYMIYEGGLRKCVKLLGPALANLQKNPKDPGALKKVEQLAIHFDRYLRPSDKGNMRELQSKILKPLEERVALLDMKKALSKLMPVFFQGTNPMNEKAQADDIAENMAWNVASYFYSKLPSLTFPGVGASPTAACDAACTVPTGSYEQSCHRPVVTYLFDTDKCLLTTRCETMYEGLPHKPASFEYAPRNSAIFLENINGTLVVHSSREEAVNARLDALSKTAETPEALLKGQEAIIGALKAGDVLTVDTDLQPGVVSAEKWVKDHPDFSAFQRIASATGGIMGYSPFSKSLNPLIEKMFAHILKTAESSEAIDIAFVLDTTSSMNPHIVQVQHNLVALLRRLQGKKEKTVANFRVALMEYQDKGDAFLNRINTGFTADLGRVEDAVGLLKTSGGGDVPEAVLDALLAAKNQLSWNPKAKHIVILIGDAPPHPRTTDGLYDEAAVVDQFQTAGTQIAVYPILSEKKEH
jgi:hypothetical protein